METSVNLFFLSDKRNKFLKKIAVVMDTINER